MRHVFFSFDWDDVWRVNQARFSWVSKGGYKEAGFVDEAKIETLKRGTDAAIRRWIDNQLYGSSVTCVMIGSQTADSKWVKYEIQQSIDRQNGLVGIYIHNMKDRYRPTSYAGRDPFSEPPFNFRPASYLVYPCCSYYDWVSDNGHWNLGDWIEKAAQQAGR